jgi:predicted DNA-binding transcriptional regulator AlpA
MASPIHRFDSVQQYCSQGRSTLTNRIAAGTFPQGFRVGAVVRGWFEHELDQWNAAVAAGASDDELRELCRRIVAARRRDVGDLIASVGAHGVPA